MIPTLPRLTCIPPVVLICAVSLAGCAYTKYMAEARERQQNLNEQLATEQDKGRMIEGESTQRKIERDQLLREEKQLQQDLAQHKKTLAQLSRVPAPRRTVNQQAEIEKLQSQIKRAETSIAEKRRRLNEQVLDY